MAKPPPIAGVFDAGATRNVEPLYGVVVAVNGTTPGPAESISYDMEFTSPSRSQIIAVSGVVPSQRRFDGTVVDIVAAAPGDICTSAWKVGPDIFFTLIEIPKHEVCPP